MKQKTIFDEENRLELLSQLGDPLEILNRVIKWEKFRSVLNQGCRKEDTGKGGDIELKIQLSQIESAIRTYEEIVEGNYIDNLIRAERERKESLQKKSEQPKQSQTVNRKDRR